MLRDPLGCRVPRILNCFRSPRSSTPSAAGPCDASPSSRGHISWPPPPSLWIQDGCHVREASAPRRRMVSLQGQEPAYDSGPRRVLPSARLSLPPPPPHETCLRVSIPATAGAERTQRVCDANADFSVITSRTQQVLSRARGKHLFNDSRWRGAAFRTWAEFSRGNRVLRFLCHREAQHVTLQVGGVSAHLPFGGSSSLILGWEAQPYQFQSPAQVHQPSLPSPCHHAVGDASRLCYVCASDEATPGAGAQR